MFHTALGLGVTSHSGSTAAARARDPGHWVVDIQSNRIDLKSVVSLLEAWQPQDPIEGYKEQDGSLRHDRLRECRSSNHSVLGNKAS